MNSGEGSRISIWNQLPPGIFYRFLQDSVLVSRKETSEVLKSLEPIVEAILKSVKSQDGRFDSHFRKSGSYIESLKVSAPNEFDFLVPLKSVSEFENFERCLFLLLCFVLQGLYMNRELPNPELPPFFLELYRRMFFELFLRVLYINVVLPNMERPPDPSYVRVLIHDQSGVEDWVQRGIGSRIFMLLPEKVMTTFKQKVAAAIRSYQDPNISLRRLQLGTPAVTFSVPIRGLEVDVDLVPVIVNPFSIWRFEWPRQSNDFPYWPSLEKVSEVKKAGVDLVAKHPKFWRYSFSRIERILMTSIDDDGGHRRDALRALKKVREDHWKSRFGKALVSYHLKTILFWACEKYPASIQWRDPVESFKRLVNFLEFYLQCEQLPHYFLGPAVNLFKADSKLQEIRAAVVLFKSDPAKYLQG